MSEDLKILIELDESDIRGLPKILYDTILKNNYREVLEIGVREGFSTRALLLALRIINGHLDSIDIVNCVTAFKNVEKLGLSGYWTFILGNSTDLGKTWAREVDMLFLDAGHLYEETVLELELFAPWVRYEILLHDTKAFPSVRKAIDTFLEERTEWIYTELDTPNPHGMGQLKRVIHQIEREYKENN